MSYRAASSLESRLLVAAVAAVVGPDVVSQLVAFGEGEAAHRVEPDGQSVRIDVAGLSSERRVVAVLGVGVAGFDLDGGVVDAGVEVDAVELTDVVSSGGVPVGGVETERLDRVGAT